MPHPSGWPVFGFGSGHPKSRNPLPVSASWRKDISSSGGIGLRLSTARTRHMSAQLVSDFAEELPALLPVLLALDALGALPVDYAEHAPAAGVLRDDDVDGVRGGRVEAHHLGN